MSKYDVDTAVILTWVAIVAGSGAMGSLFVIYGLDAAVLGVALVFSGCLYTKAQAIQGDYADEWDDEKPKRKRKHSDVPPPPPAERNPGHGPMAIDKSDGKPDPGVSITTYHDRLGNFRKETLWAVPRPGQNPPTMVFHEPKRPPAPDPQPTLKIWKA